LWGGLNEISSFWLSDVQSNTAGKEKLQKSVHYYQMQTGWAVSDLQTTDRLWSGDHKQQQQEYQVLP
jgi:hypothetical protein